MVSEQENQPPVAHNINGPTSNNTSTSYDYTFSANDHEGDMVRYIIDWGSRSQDITIVYFSGEQVTVNHNWGSENTFTITANAEDENGLHGPENTLEVSMPKSKKNSIYSILFQL